MIEGEAWVHEAELTLGDQGSNPKTATPLGVPT